MAIISAIITRVQYSTREPQMHFCRALLELQFSFLSNWKVYDRTDTFPFDYEPNKIPFEREQL